MADENGTATAPAPAHWAETLPGDFTLEKDGVNIPAKEFEFVRNTKDVPALVKQFYDAQREMGRRVRVPDAKTAKPEELAGFKQKLIENGILPPPIKGPEEYAIKKPDQLPPGLNWNDELAGELAKTLHKHGAPKELANDLLQLHMKAMGETKSLLNTNREEGVAKLKLKYGADYEEKAAGAARFASKFLAPEEWETLNAAGLLDHPGFLSTLMKLAPLAEADSSFVPEVQDTGGRKSPEEVQSELGRLMSDPTHPMHLDFKRNTPKAQRYVDQLYADAYGRGTTQL